MRLYTRGGDDGTTGLLFGGRVSKDDPGPAAFGAVDEAVSALGLARAETDPEGELHGVVLRIQRELFVVGAELATAPERRDRLSGGVTRVEPDMVRALEPLVDDVSGRYEPPTEFVVPGENRVAAALDLARTIVRRAEREAVHATRVGWLEETSSVVPYLNRLADLCYALARWQEGDWRPMRER